MIYIETNKKLRELYSRFSKMARPVHRAYIKSIRSLVNIAEAKDPYTKRHSLMVSNYAVLLARYIGLTKAEVENIRLSALLHDIGKIGISDKILLKKSALTKEEFKEIEKHPKIGSEIIKPLEFFNDIIPIIEHHHENYDGSGYPDGLKGEEIPLGSRILAIADVYDALTNQRAYRKAYSHKKAIQIMKKETKRKFDPTLMSVFLSCLSSKRKGKMRWKSKKYA